MSQSHQLAPPTTTNLMVAPPRINLRRAASYNAQDRGPISSTSSRFNFNHLLFSPPPSPSLPALVPRPKKSPTKILVTRPSRILRRLVYLVGLFLVVYVLGLVFQGQNVMPAVWPYFANEEFEMVGQDAVPDFATPIVVSDNRGQMKWTVSIPPNQVFPLSIEQYSEMSGQCHEVSARARDLHHETPLSDQAVLSYDAPDDYFVDVYEAERTNLLPSTWKGIPVKDSGHFVGMEADAMAGRPVCQSTLTFVLESPDAGLGNTLMMLWTFYALAKDQGRAFFIDDSRWAYGTYTEIFEAPPMPNCRPPPRHHMVPCPSQARHLVVSAVTAKEVFPALLAKNNRISGTDRGLEGLFALARTGYRALFTLNDGDQRYVDSRVRVIRKKAMATETKPVDEPVIGLHIRHGDQHPLEFQYRDAYIPGELYLDTRSRLVEEHYNESYIEVENHRSITLLASDDPTVHESPEFAQTIQAQERIRLASKVAIESANPNPHVLHNFVDETFGWEGGFFAAMFWNLGVDRKNNAANAPAGVSVEGANAEANFQAPPSEQTLRLRSMIGRAYLMDLAVLSGASDQIVCAVSAMGCRLLAVMMGWEKAIDGGGWVNIDGSYGWTGIDW